MIVSVLSFLLVIGICVVTHEYGHYRTAKACGVRVHEFAFGMGPVLWQKKGRETLWSIRAFPVGGFVRLAGMDEEQPGEEVKEGKGFNDKKAWQRFFILLNGPLVNILLAMALTAIFLSAHGVIDMSSPVVGDIMENLPAQHIELQPGDIIRTVNGVHVSDWPSMAKAIRDEAKEGPVTLEIERGGQLLLKEVAIPYSAKYGAQLLGIRPPMMRYGLLSAWTNAFSYTVNMSVEMIQGIVRWVLQAQDVDVSGPIGIATMAGEAAKQGIWPFISFLSLINLNLGLINLFPFPALDGGRLVFIVGEIVTKKRLPERIENFIHLAGFILLITLILFITWKDISKIFNL